MQGRLEGKVCYITGAASGIGLACAQRLAQESAVVIGSDIQTNKQWSQLVGEGTPLFELDVRDEIAQHEIVTQILAEYGRIDGVVTAAGVAGGGPVHALDIENWQLV